MLDVRFNVPASDFSTMRVGGTLAQLVTITTSEDIPLAYAQAQAAGLPLRILGGGSNTVFGDANLPYFFAHMCIDGIAIEQETETTATISCGAGVQWDMLVDWCVSRGYHGIELLSWIPGTVGAAPVQNIGAYGVELADSCLYVDFYHWQQQKVQRISAGRCQFGYRDSVFKHALAGKGIIVAVGLSLSKQPAAVLEYKGLDHLPADTAIDTGYTFFERGIKFHFIQ
jgi:UDP-N-acetylmuramate dehydrogenase